MRTIIWEPWLFIIQASKRSGKSIFFSYSMFFFVLLLSLTLSISFTSCSSKVDITSLPFEIPQTFSDTGSYSVPSKWWTGFEDEQLNTIIDNALLSNLTLRSAYGFRLEFGFVKDY